MKNFQFWLKIQEKVKGLVHEKFSILTQNPRKSKGVSP